MRTLPFVLLLMLLLVSGCDSNGSNGDDDDTQGQTGSFTATVTGAVSASLQGTATFGASAAGQDSADGFGLVMGSSSVNPEIVFGSAQPRPGTGTQTVINFVESGSATSGQVFATYTRGTVVYGSVSGTLRLTESSDSEVAGTFEFEAINLINPTETVTVSGSFDARGIDIGSR